MNALDISDISPVNAGCALAGAESLSTYQRLHKDPNAAL